jgi:1-deoxy-D-xylulose-5-phosphate reductoisomerase
MKRLAVLGSTGSIGTSALSVVEAFPEQFEIDGLAAGQNLDLLRAQVARHKPSLVAVARAEDAETLASEFANTAFVAGGDGLEEVACCEKVEMVVSALVGSIGLRPTIAAIRAGKDVALANKETLVVAGDLVMSEAEKCGVQVLPVDSEHAALHQVLGGVAANTVARVVLTASGGPFRSWPSPRIAAATVAEALDHPTWTMGTKVTIDSATMMNKGLEIIEAHHLFALPEGRIDVVIHPQSLVHCIVEHIDGTMVAQMAPNDMRLPILYALSWPDRLAAPIPALDLVAASQLTFEAPDDEKFPALALARSALRSGGEMPAVLNAANEVAVAAFLDGHCPLPAITATVGETLDRWASRNRPLTDIEQALAADREARVVAQHVLGKYLRLEIGSE